MVAIHYHILAVPLGETNICSFYRQRVSVALQREFRPSLSCVGQLWQQEERSLLLGLMCFQNFCSSLCMTCFVLLVMGLGLGFVFSYIRAPHCVFCTFKCALLFGLWFFLFSSLVPVLGVFPLFIYLGNRLESTNMMKKLKFFVCTCMAPWIYCMSECVTICISCLSPTLHKVLLLPLSWLPGSHVSPSLTPQHLISQHWFSVSQNFIVAINTTLSFPKFFLGHVKCGHRFQMACWSWKFLW
jgi:hypothetical protein